MTHNQYINKYNGKYIDYDGSFGSQCVDLMRSYVKEVVGLNPYIAIPTRGYAKDIFKRFVNNHHYTKVYNSPTNVPKQGDIIFWGTYPFVTGIAGHVGIVESANVNNFVVFNQNYPTNTPCQMRKFSYKGIMGWLTKK